MAKKQTGLGAAPKRESHNPNFDRVKRSVTEETTRLNVNVPSDLYEEFKRITSRKRLPMSAVVVWFIERYVNKNK